MAFESTRKYAIGGVGGAAAILLLFGIGHGGPDGFSKGVSTAMANAQIGETPNLTGLDPETVKGVGRGAVLQAILVGEASARSTTDATRAAIACTAVAASTPDFKDFSTSIDTPLSQSENPEASAATRVVAATMAANRCIAALDAQLDRDSVVTIPIGIPTIPTS